MGWPRFRSGDDPDAVCHRRVVGTDIGVLGVVVRHHPPYRAAGEGRECRSGAVNSSCGRLTCPRFSRPSDDHEEDGLPWPRAGTRLLGLGCRQKILACPDACPSAAWLSPGLACGVAGVAQHTSHSGSGQGWGERRIRHRARGTWTPSVSLGRFGVAVPSAPAFVTSSAPTPADVGAVLPGSWVPFV